MSAQTQWQTPGEGHELEAGAFGPTPSVTGSLQEIGGRPTTYWNDAIRRIRHNKLAVAGLWIISFLLVVAVIGPMLSPYSYEQQDLNNTYQ